MKKLRDDFHEIIIKEIPLIDIRAPVEYVKGAVPTAVNLPILDDKQRHEVGLCYKQNGSDAAMELGKKLVSGEIKRSRVEAWQNFINSNPGTSLYCFRGGKRSQIAQEWLENEMGVTLSRLAGGYKAMRNYLLEHLKPSKLSCKPLLLGGRTGSGKTILLNELDNSVDLEGLANHRGSSFGRFLSPQPTQVNFENHLAWNLVQHRHKGYKWLVLEDEGHYVGSRNIPREAADFFNSGDVIILEVPLEERMNIIFDEYITGGQCEYLKHYGQQDGLQQWYEAMVGNVDRIRKRLGGEKTTQVKKLLEDAWQKQLQSQGSQAHRKWLEVLICEYYDPMYDYKMAKKEKNILFRGNCDEVRAFIRSLP
jgi:tRNA 2-selenouridine synthase